MSFKTSSIIMGLWAVAVIAFFFIPNMHSNESYSHLDAAGEWINFTIPKGSTIGAWGGGFSPFDFPAIHFENYQIVSVPHPGTLDFINPPLAKMPQFLFLGVGQSEHLAQGKMGYYPKSHYLDEHYVTIWEWRGELPLFKKIFGVPDAICGYNGDVKIMGKK